MKSQILNILISLWTKVDVKSVNMGQWPGFIWLEQKCQIKTRPNSIENFAKFSPPYFMPESSYLTYITYEAIFYMIGGNKGPG